MSTSYLSLTLPVVWASSRINSILKLPNSNKKYASSKVRLGSYDGIWYTEYSGTILVSKSEIWSKAVF